MEMTWDRAGNARGPETAGSPSGVLSALYDEYGTDVLRLCFAFMKNRQDAEDAAQETFLKVWRKLDTFEGRRGCAVRSWIMRVACNTCRDLLRKGKRKRREQPFAWDAPFCPGESSGEDRDLVLDVLALPEKYRSVILMVYWQKMTVRETAGTLGISRSTVSRRLEKARSMLEG